MQGLCDSKADISMKIRSRSNIQVDQGGESADKLWEAEVTEGSEQHLVILIH